MKLTDPLFRNWLYESAFDLIKDGLFMEGGELLYFHKFYEKEISLEKFKEIITEVLNWDDKDIEETILKLKGLQAFT